MIVKNSLLSLLRIFKHFIYRKLMNKKTIFMALSIAILFSCKAESNQDILSHLQTQQDNITPNEPAKFSDTVSWAPKQTITFVGKREKQQGYNSFINAGEYTPAVTHQSLNFEENVLRDSPNYDNEEVSDEFVKMIEKDGTIF